MKPFETPELDILRFAVEDIITTSGGPREDEGEMSNINEISTLFRITGV